MSEKQKLSVIVPCYNEEQVIQQTHARLTAVLAGLDMDWEILYVNDGSRDKTEEILRQLAAENPSVRAVMFARNFGHQIAVTAGVDHARGDAIIIIDADLQDPPELIPQMLTLWREGNQVVYGVRTDREGETAFKLWTAKTFYRCINAISEVPIPLDTGDFRLIDRSVAEALKKMPERDRFIRGMVSWIGFKHVAMPYKRAARAAGETKYPLKKMIKFATDGILSFSIVPLRLASIMGFISVILSVVVAMYAMVSLLFCRCWPWSATILIAVLFFGGVQLITTGILGEYVGRIYMQSKHRPLYLLKEMVGE